MRQAQLLGMAPRLGILGLSLFSLTISPITLQFEPFQYIPDVLYLQFLEYPKFFSYLHAFKTTSPYNMECLGPTIFEFALEFFILLLWIQFWEDSSFPCEITGLSLLCLHMIELRSPSSAKTFCVILHNCTSVTLNCKFLFLFVYTQ